MPDSEILIWKVHSNGNYFFLKSKLRFSQIDLNSGHTTSWILSSIYKKYFLNTNNTYSEMLQNILKKRVSACYHGNGHQFSIVNSLLHSKKKLV